MQEEFGLWTLLNKRKSIVTPTEVSKFLRLLIYLQFINKVCL
jgi:hypothetical protein